MTQKVGYGLALGTSTGAPKAKSATNGGVPAGDPGDMENRIISYSGETYMYAPDNKRVMREFVVNGVTKQHIFFWVGSLRVGTYDLWVNPNTQQGTAVVVKEDLYVAGRRVAPSDRLGSDLSSGVRLMPYGEDLAVVANDRTKFATYHRDATGLDYADQRYYSPGTGRFMSVDSADGLSDNPASWNRYTYAWNDPINLIDTDGRLPNKVEGVWDAIKDFWNNLGGDGEDMPVGADIPDRSAPRIVGSTPSFRNRWEEDYFFRRPCREHAPEAPEGVDIDANIAEAKAKLREFMDLASQAPRAAIDVNVLIGAWFAEKVKTGGDWDYKQRGSAYQAFGNYNYGAVGAAIGYTPTLLKLAGGAVQNWTDRHDIVAGRPRIGQGFFWGGPPYGDDPNDQAVIQAGTDYAYERYHRQCP